MRLVATQTFGKLRDLLQENAPAPEQLSSRLKIVEKDVILPVKGIFIAINFYYLYFSRWFEDLKLPRSIAQQYVEHFFLLYLLINIAVGAVLLRWHRFSMNTVQRVVFASNFLDGLFIAALVFVSGDGFNSTLYWLFAALIVRNTIVMPQTAPQWILNGSAILLYFLAGILNLYINPETLGFTQNVAGQLREATTEPVMRIIVLLLIAACCYGVQALFERQRQAFEEARESAVRQEQLQSAGRLAAQIAHQIKNPLCIINNAAYTVQRAIEQGKSPNLKQVEIIREEVERSDQILTRLMGYAQLAEGTVERLRIDEELDRAIEEVFPSAAAYEATIETEYAEQLPPLFMQRGHLSEILVNILQNAREATAGKGHIQVRTQSGPEQSIIISMADDGPGIQKCNTSKVFEAYFSTKEKGTGLGLSIAKHNVEMYGGTISVESELGKGARFIIQLPTKSFMKLQK